jgi:hypothetical protein
MRSIVFILVVGSLFLFSLTACHESTELDFGIHIEGLTNDTLVVESTVLSFDITVTAQNGLSQFKVNDLEFDVKGLKSFNTTYTFKADLNTPSGRKEEDTVPISVFVKDQDGDVAQKSMKIRIISVQRAIQQGYSQLQDTTIFFVDRDIATDQIWYTGKIYVLKKRITVKAPAKLTIQKGVIVKGETNLQETSALVISRGAKIDAQGTNNQPIIFTTSLDYIAPGEINPKQNFSFLDMHWWDEGREIDYSQEKGLWGGLIVLGKAKGSFPGDVSEYSLQGFEGLGESAKYGGGDNEDNSGILNNVFIRYAGNRQNPSKRIPSLTLAGVGSGTQIENVEIYQGAEDGVAILGGTVNLSNLFVSSVAEDAIQVDQGWSGRLDNFIIANSGDNGIEIEGPKGSKYNGNHIFRNGYIFCYPCKGYVSFKENSNSNFSKTIFFLHRGMLGTFLFDLGIDRVPKSFDSKIENLEVLDMDDPYGGFPSNWRERFFKELTEDQIKLVEYEKHTVGPYLNQFHWSWLLRFYENGGAYIPGL